jgi:hypothetical protein
MKPVAWIGKPELQFGFTDTRVTNEKESWDDIPLYTHPAKTLTDEEIQELALCDEFWISEDCTIFDWHKFARAILRKAQEK